MGKREFIHYSELHYTHNKLNKNEKISCAKWGKWNSGKIKAKEEKKAEWSGRKLKYRAHFLRYLLK